MSWARIQEQWKQRRGKADKHEEQVGRLQEKYGVAKHEAKQQINEDANYTFTKVGIVHDLPPELSFARLQFVKRL